LIVSFDIDNTLIPYSNEFEIIYPNKFFKLIGAEPIRKGTHELFRYLRQNNYEIWIYTTSFRSTFHLRKTFWAHQLYPNRFINEPINQKILRKNNCRASKNPKFFGIDLHIDDSEGVAKEGEIYDFKTVIISVNDDNWVETIKKSIL